MSITLDTKDWTNTPIHIETISCDHPISNNKYIGKYERMNWELYIFM